MKMKAKFDAYDYAEDSSLNHVVKVIRKDGSVWHCVKAQLYEEDGTIAKYKKAKKGGQTVWEQS